MAIDAKSADTCLDVNPLTHKGDVISFELDSKGCNVDQVHIEIVDALSSRNLNETILAIIPEVALRWTIPTNEREMRMSPQ